MWDIYIWHIQQYTYNIIDYVIVKKKWWLIDNVMFTQCHTIIMYTMYTMCVKGVCDMSNESVWMNFSLQYNDFVFVLFI